MMKKRFSFLLFASVCFGEWCFAQHIPPCESAGNPHTQSICYGYAMGRAFDRDDGDSDCNAGNLFLDGGIQSTFFQSYTYSLGSVTEGDIISFDDHACYVVLAVQGPNPVILVDQVPDEGAAVQRNKNLEDDVIPSYGTPTGIWRKKKQWRVKVENEFDSGEIGFKFGSGSTSRYPSDFVSSYFHWEKKITIEAVNHNEVVDGIWRLFEQWQDEGSRTYPSTKWTHDAEHYKRDDPYDYTAQFTDAYKLTFRNQFPGASGYPGTIEVGGNTESSPHVQFVKIGEDITLEWDQHPNSNVKYQIWRIVKPQNQSQQDPELMTTLNHNATSWTDLEYIMTSSYTVDLLSYDVRAHFPGVGTADPDYLTVFGEGGLIKVADTNGEWAFTDGARPESFAVSAHPNPFNPSTKITYELPEPAFVTLIIFDVRGKRVLILVDGEKPAGYYGIRWDGANENGVRVASGIYFYRLFAKPFSGKSPVVESGKLLLAKYA